MAITRNDNFEVRAPKPIDGRYGMWESGSWRAFYSPEEAIQVLGVYRYIGLTVLVQTDQGNVEYWWKDNITDSGLVEKTVEVDLSNYYTKTELQTPGLAQIHFGNLTNVPDFLTSVDWSIITGDQSVVGVGGFDNDVGYITSADVPTYTFANGLREEGGTVKLGLDLSTLGTTNIGALTEPTFLLLNSTDGLANSYLIFNNTPNTTGATLGVTEPLGSATINFASDPNSIDSLWIVDTIHQKGLGEIDDYSANKTDYSYVTLKMLNEKEDAFDKGNLVAGSNVTLSGTLTNRLVGSGNVTVAVDIPPVDLSGYYTKVELQTSGSAQVHWDNLTNVPALVPESRTVTAGTGLTGGGSLSANISLAFDTAWGDTRYSQVGHTHSIGDITGLQTALNNKVNTSTTITAGYAMDISGSWTSGWGFGVDTDVLDTRYLRKDANDSNGVFSLSLGNMVAETATVQSTLTLPSLADNPLFTYLLTIDDVTNEVTKSLFDFSAVGFMVQNAAGVNQFFIPLQDSIRFAAGGDASISFNATTKTVTITATGGSGSSGILSVFGRTGPNIVAEAGDYNTSLVTEDPSALYFTPARVRSTALTGLSITDTAILATDTILQAFGKAQGQINARVPSNRTLTINGTSGNITVSGGTFDLSANRTWTVNLATVGTAGTYTKVTTDAFGRVISSSALLAADIPSLAISKITGLQTALDGKESLSNKATSFTTINNTLYPTTQAVVDYVTGQFPTNYVTTDTNQANITGGKAWLNAARWTPGNQTPTATAKSIGIGGNTNGAYIQGFQQSSTASSFSLRAYAVSGVQLLLSEGGIDAVGNSTFATSVSTPLIKSTAGDFLTFQGETTGLMYLSNNGLGIGATPSAARASALQVTGNIWATDAYILGLTNTPIAEFGLDGNVFVRTMGTQSLSLQTNTLTRILIAGTGAVTISSLAGTGDRMVVANSSGLLSTQPIPSGGGSQTLSFSAPGQLSISGGNSVNVSSLYRYVLDTNFETWASTLNGGGLYTFSSTTGTTNTPTAGGGGIIYKRNGTINPLGTIALFASDVAGNNNLYYRTGNTNSTWDDWRILANQDWVTSQIPTNYVTTNTTQTVTGSKTWGAAQGYNNLVNFLNGNSTRYFASNDAIIQINARPDPDNAAHARWYLYGTAAPSGNTSFKQAWYDGAAYMNVDVTSTTVDFTRRLKSATTTGWVDIGSVNSSYVHYNTDRPAHYFYKDLEVQNQLRIDGGGNTTFTSAGGPLALKNSSSNPYLSFHNAAGDRIGYIQATSTVLSLNSAGTTTRIMDLAGTGNRMVIANANGDLSTQAIPVNGVTSVATGTGLTGGTITSTGTISVGPHHIPETSTSLGTSDLNSIITPGFYHQTSNANATVARNYPTTNAGTLIVTEAAGIIQMYYQYGTGTGIWKRAFYSSSWSAWYRIDANTTYSAGNGLNLSGTSFSLGTPSTITGSTTNSVTASSHTHALTLVSADITGALGFTPVTNARTVTAGNGLTGGGALSSNITVTLGTPSSITLSSTNSVTSTSHTHAFAPGGTTSQYIRGDGSLATFPTIPPAISLVTAGVTTVGAVRYNGTSSSAGVFYGGTANPNSSTRLNYNGIFHAFDFVGYGTSDRRLKQNIVKITDPLEKIQQLNGYSFDWKNGHESYEGHDYGLIAQEVEKVLPELVRERGGIKGIKSGNGLVALLLEGVKVLNKRVEALENGLSG